MSERWKIKQRKRGRCIAFPLRFQNGSVLAVRVIDPAAGFDELEVEITDCERIDFGGPAVGDGEGFLVRIGFAGGFRAGEGGENIVDVRFRQCITRCLKQAKSKT